MKATLTLLTRRQTGLLSELTVLLTKRGFQLRRQQSLDTDQLDQMRLILHVSGGAVELPELVEELNALDAVLTVEATLDEEAVSRLTRPVRSTKEPLNQSIEVDASYRKKDLAKELADTMALLSTQFFDAETNTFDYYAFTKERLVFSRYLTTVGALSQFDPNTLDSQQAKLAFWLNVYNSLIIHGVIAHQVSTAINSIKEFFTETRYVIGGQVLTPDIIEHGILRGNKRRYWGLAVPLEKTDSRVKWVMATLDPRIHFSFYSACLSSPALRGYYAESLHEQLREATMVYLNSHLQVNAEGTGLRLPKMFQWYPSDFGTQQNMLSFIADHLTESYRKTLLQERSGRLSFDFIDFDWTLNQPASS